MRTSRFLLPVFALTAVAALVIYGSSAGRAQTRVSLVVWGGTVVTMDGSDRVIPAGAVVINDDKILAVGPADDINQTYSAAQKIDVRGQVILPGLVNTHTHAPMVLYRGLSDDLALMDWLNKYIFPAEAKTVSPDFVRIGTRLAALEMIQSGTTTFADMYYFEDDIAQATHEAGLRGVLGQSVIKFPVADVDDINALQPRFDIAGFYNAKNALASFRRAKAPLDNELVDRTT
jgi:5-methylthioadenosine/S-adenosylhomocysteine deaminase